MKGMKSVSPEACIYLIFAVQTVCSLCCNLLDIARLSLLPPWSSFLSATEILSFFPG